MRQPVIVGAGSPLGPIKSRDKFVRYGCSTQHYVSMTWDHRLSKIFYCGFVRPPHLRARGFYAWTKNAGTEFSLCAWAHQRTGSSDAGHDGSHGGPSIVQVSRADVVAVPATQEGLQNRERSALHILR